MSGPVPMHIDMDKTALDPPALNTRARTQARSQSTIVPRPTSGNLPFQRRPTSYAEDNDEEVVEMNESGPEHTEQRFARLRIEGGNAQAEPTNGPSSSPANNTLRRPSIRGNGRPETVTGGAMRGTNAAGMPLYELDMGGAAGARAAAAQEGFDVCDPDWWVNWFPCYEKINREGRRRPLPAGACEEGHKFQRDEREWTRRYGFEQ